MALPETDLGFPAMGCAIRLLVGESTAPGGPNAAETAASTRTIIEDFGMRLSRFEAESELVALNSDPRETVEVSPLMAAMVGAAIWAAERTDGLIDPTLVGELEDIGYGQTRRGMTSASLSDALASAPAREPARPTKAARWREISVDSEALTVTRPVGLRIDSGPVGKGLAADSVAALLTDRTRFCVNASGDLRIGGPDALEDPYFVNIEDPFGGEPLLSVRVGEGAVATSGIDSRLWQNEDKSFSHHLLDPSTGKPAWTGIVQATAFAPSALEAETLAKQALLSGPTRARAVLENFGGVIVTDDHEIEAVGPVADHLQASAIGLQPASEVVSA